MTSSFVIVWTGMENAFSVRCPRCRKRVQNGTPNFPFCSERCRLVDLGSWFSEDYKLSRPIHPSSLEEDELFGDTDAQEGERRPWSDE